jgi:hypothetical protein
VPYHATRRVPRCASPSHRDSSPVVGKAWNGFSNADPADPGTVDVVGFDTATPRLVPDLARSAL